MDVAQLLGVDGDGVSDEQRTLILGLFHDVRQRALESETERRAMMKLVLMDQQEQLSYRQTLAEGGIEYTPSEVTNLLKVMRIVLKTL